MSQGMPRKRPAWGGGWRQGVHGPTAKAGSMLSALGRLSLAKPKVFTLAYSARPKWIQPLPLCRSLVVLLSACL